MRPVRCLASRCRVPFEAAADGSCSSVGLRVASRTLSGSGRDLEYQIDIVRAMDVLIRDLPDEVHAELARRAAASDMSLRAYLREVLSDHVAVPSMGEWLQRVRDLGPVAASDASGPELVAAARAQDDELLGR